MENESTLQPREIGAELSPEFAEALSLHQRILADSRIITSSILDLAKNLSEMHDKKLYSELGYETFEDYAEKAVGIGQRHAYNFIKILDTYREDGLQQYASLGVSKLIALAQLDDADRAELIDSGKAEEMSVRELNEQIKALTQKCEQLTFELSEAQSVPDETYLLSVDYQAAQSEIERLQAELEEERRCKVLPAPEMSPEEKEIIRREIETEAYKSTELKEAEIKSLQARLNDTGNAMRAADVKRKEAEKRNAENAGKIKELADALAAAEKEKAELQTLAKKAQSAPPPSGNKELLKYHFDAIKRGFDDSAEVIRHLDNPEEREKFKGALIKLAEACVRGAENV